MVSFVAASTPAHTQAVVLLRCSILGPWFARICYLQVIFLG